MENIKNKVLVIIDRTFKNERIDEDYELLENVIINSLTKKGYDVDFKIQSTFLSAYDCDFDAEMALKQIDEDSAFACINDYDVVIVEGTASWFWLQAMYTIPIICINPIVDIFKEYEEQITDDLKYVLDDIYETRGFQTNMTMCVISNENYDNVQYYDNVFTDNTVVRSDYDLISEDFWTDTNSLIKALKYIINNYGE